MSNAEFIDFQTVISVARGLGELREKVVFVGGAVLGFYADDPATEELRPTRDVDLTVEIANLSDWARLQERLSELGFVPDASQTVICRYLFQEIKVDIMPAEDSPFGPSNAWYKPAFPFAKQVEIAKGLKIRLFPIEYILATKFAAFAGRGNDPRTSHDFEDIIFIVNNRVKLVDEILWANSEVRYFLKKEFLQIWQNRSRDEIISCHLNAVDRRFRLPLILGKIEKIILAT